MLLPLPSVLPAAPRRASCRKRGGKTCLGGGRPPNATLGAAAAAASLAAFPRAYAVSEAAEAACSADATRAAATTSTASPGALVFCAAGVAATPGARVVVVAVVVSCENGSRSGYSAAGVTPYPPTAFRDARFRPPRESNTSSFNTCKVCFTAPGDDVSFERVEWG